MGRSQNENKKILKTGAGKERLEFSLDNMQTYLNLENVSNLVVFNVRKRTAYPGNAASLIAASIPPTTSPVHCYSKRVYRHTEYGD